MSDEIRVRVVEFGDRKHYQLQWTCPLSGRKKTKSSGIERTGRKKERDDAQRAANKLEAELLAGKHASGSRLTWEAFRERYEREVAPAKAENTQSKIGSVFNQVEKILNPAKLAHLTPARLSYFQAEMRRKGMAEASIKSNLAILKSALRWAARMKLLHEAPAIEMPSRAGDKMKGRPITGEEFDRMTAAVAKVVPVADVANWQRLLNGLWLSGLRINEALNLWWDRDDQLRVDLDGRRPMLWIPARLDKGGKNRLLPITPDFAAFLAATPAAERRGKVFKLPGPGTRTVACHVVSAIGEAAGIKVEERQSKGSIPDNNPLVKYASAHDLRRSFGLRWSKRVMPNVLRELMRHRTIATTMTFYVGQDAERTADALWATFDQNGNTFGNSQPGSVTANIATTGVTACATNNLQ